jgi:hypothetical protein
MTGTEMLLNQVFKLLGLDGEKVKSEVANIGQFVVTLRDDLQTLKNQQQEIINLLKARNEPLLPFQQPAEPVEVPQRD